MKQMGFMDKLLDVMRLNEDDYEFDNDEYEFEDDYEEEEVKEKKPSRKERKEEQQAKRNETNFDMSERRQKNVNKITPITKNKKQGQQGMEVCVIKPNAIEDELEITETLLNGRTVVINMEGLRSALSILPPEQPLPCTEIFRKFLIIFSLRHQTELIFPEISRI